MFTLRFDMRSQSPGLATSELYAAATEMSAWADTRGCVAVVLCEHHCADDGYLPSPLLLGAAIAARTEQCDAEPDDPPALLRCGPARGGYFRAGPHQRGQGRLYLRDRLPAEEFDHFGLSLSDRGRIADEKLPCCAACWPAKGRTRRQADAGAPRPRTPEGPGCCGGGRAWRRPGVRDATAWACLPTAGCRDAGGVRGGLPGHGFEPGFALIPERDVVANLSSPTTSTRLGTRSASTCCTTRWPTRNGTPTTRCRPTSKAPRPSPNCARRRPPTRSCRSTRPQRVRAARFQSVAVVRRDSARLAWPYLKRFAELN